jgi:hypothetical protein
MKCIEHDVHENLAKKDNKLEKIRKKNISKKKKINTKKMKKKSHLIYGPIWCSKLRLAHGRGEIPN